MEHDEDLSSFSIGQSAQERGLSYVPKCYLVSGSTLDCEVANIPSVDLAGLHQDPAWRSTVIREIGDACSRLGFFQIVNHGIDQSILDGALSTASDFFKLPSNEKMKLASNDVRKPVRYGTRLKDGIDKVQFWRVFLKHYAHPLQDWIGAWPDNPPNYYRKEIGNYAVEVRKLVLELTEAICESLGLTRKYLSQKMEDGMQTQI